MSANANCPDCGVAVGKLHEPTCRYLNTGVRVNPWRPITDPAKLRVLGKAGEEITEAATAIFRCIIQGIDEREPVTGKLNRQWLREELADIRAAVRVMEEELHLSRMRDREKNKYRRLLAWRELIK